MAYKKDAVKNFWNEYGMTYDWEKKHDTKEGTKEWFRRIDKTLFNEERFLRDKNGRPFGKIIPFDKLKGKKALEIGCGMGSLTELMIRNGIITTSIDLTEKAVRNTKKRLELLKEEKPELKKIIEKSVVKQDDAENLSFKDNSFDFVLSWGVIHHSPDTRKCVKEIYRVLKPGGISSGMVYNKSSIIYYIHYMLIRGIFMGKLLKYSPRELADRYSDGFQFGVGCPKAEHFTFREWRNILKQAGFKKIRLRGSSQTTDIAVLGTRKFLDKIIPNSVYDFIFKRWGWFLVWNKIEKPLNKK